MSYHLALAVTNHRHQRSNHPCPEALCTPHGYHEGSCSTFQTSSAKALCTKHQCREGGAAKDNLRLVPIRHGGIKVHHHGVVMRSDVRDGGGGGGGCSSGWPRDRLSDGCGPTTRVGIEARALLLLPTPPVVRFTYLSRVYL